MNTNSFRSLFGLAALASVIGTQGCVADRPSRNGVFDENQYIRKDFLIQNVNGQPDPGWYMKATIVQTSTPNPLAGQFDMFTGAENSGALVRFGITSDKLNLIDMRELTTDPTVAAQNATTSSIVNAWPITNVDLKYYINLDGEKTNQYQENQELDWQVRQWVKLNFDKNDFSDVAALGPFQSLFLQKCASGEGSGTLVPNSFQVDTTNDYMTWTVAVTVPLNLTDADCMTAFGSAGMDFLRMNRSAVTMNVMYSMSRAKPVDPTTYAPLEIAEKDSIRHKYGPIEITNYSRDMDSGLLAARQLTVRYNPNKPIVWYFAQGYPTAQEDMWTRPGTGIVAQTNAVFAQAGAAARLSVLHYDDNAFNDHAGPKRQYGDVRYNFIRWESDLDTDSPFLAVTQFQPDLRTGEIVSASINVADAPLKDFLGQRTAAYLASVDTINPFTDPPPDYSKYTTLNPVVGTLPASCTVGDALPLVPDVVKAAVYAKSTLYQRMAQYLPPAPDGAATPGPTDYIFQHNTPASPTFQAAYYEIMPYLTYADPAANQFVTSSPVPGSGDDENTGLNLLASTLHSEAQFQSAISDYDHGQGLAAFDVAPGAAGVQAAYNSIDAMRQLWKAHDDYRYAWSMHHSLMRGDTTAAISFPQIVSRSSRHCVGAAGAAWGSAGGHWQSVTEWQNELIQSYYETIVWHEFGHVLGLEHNFMGNVDKANFPQYTDVNGTKQYGKLTSSLMEYSSSYDDTYWNNGDPVTKGGTPATGWLAYDQGAIGFIYGNNLSSSKVGPQPYPTGSSDTTTSISGQFSPTIPWNDPYGYQKDGKTEINFLRCSEEHMRYTPLCKQFDVGSTPSEIVAADIEAYDWNYKWTNFRNYYKVWDDSNYGTRVANMMSESRRFMSMANWDWNASELTDKLIRIGISPPANAGAVNSGNFYTQLTNEFISDINSAMQMNAAFHEAIIQQSSGQRSFQTVWDPYFGDVTQQGISLDKEFATTEWLGLWPYDNYDPTQSAGYYGSSMVNGPGLTSPAQAWSTTSSFLGEKGNFDAYPTLFPSAVALFGHDTQSVLFEGLGYAQMRDWIGGHSFFRIEDVLAYFRNIAAQNPNQVNGCADYATCTYNPMDPQTDATDGGHSSTVHAFVGPDNRRWTWVYLQDRNQYFFVDQDRNPSSYFQVLTYNQALLSAFDDGNPPTTIYGDDINTKFMIDAFGLFGGEDSTAE